MSVSRTSHETKMNQIHFLNPSSQNNVTPVFPSDAMCIWYELPTPTAKSKAVEQSDTPHDPFHQYYRPSPKMPGP